MYAVPRRRSAVGVQFEGLKHFLSAGKNSCAVQIKLNSMELGSVVGVHAGPGEKKQEK